MFVKGFKKGTLILETDKNAGTGLKIWSTGVERDHPHRNQSTDSASAI